MALTVMVADEVVVKATMLASGSSTIIGMWGGGGGGTGTTPDHDGNCVSGPNLLGQGGMGALCSGANAATSNMTFASNMEPDFY